MKVFRKQPDCADNEVTSKRDLKDFARLWVNVAGLRAGLMDGTFKLGLKWKSAGALNPVIKVYKAVESDGGTKYLTDEGTAAAQITGINQTAKATVSGDNPTPVLLPTSTFANINPQNPIVPLLFESVSEGKGYLIVTLHKADGTELGEGVGVWLDLKDVKKMYLRGRASENIASPFDYGNLQPPDPGVTCFPDPNGHAFSKPQDETRQTIVFIHGWRMSYDDSLNYSETLFKRLWHRGFKGRFAFFRWPTFTSNIFDDIPEWVKIAGVPPSAYDAWRAKYNESEYRAWKSGAALKQFVDGLPYPEAKNICAHSMGNIVVGEAMRLGMQVDNYILMQAAVPSCAYNVNQAITPAINSSDIIHAAAA